MSPIMPSRECPAELLPKTALSLTAAAESTGWRWLARIAIAEDGTRSIVVYCGRDCVRVTARFEGPIDGSKMSFKSGWVSPGAMGIPDGAGYRELLAVLKRPRPEDVLTAGGFTAADLNRDM